MKRQLNCSICILVLGISQFFNVTVANAQNQIVDSVFDRVYTNGWVRDVGSPTVLGPDWLSNNPGDPTRLIGQGWKRGLFINNGPNAEVEVRSSFSQSATVLEIRRSGAGGAGQGGCIFQDINLDVTAINTLRLSGKVRIDAQSLAGGGVGGAEYPVTLMVGWTDANGTYHWDDGVGFSHFVQAFYIVSGNLTVTRSQQIPANQWYHYSSPNLKTLFPNIVRIDRVGVGFGGWDYHSYCDDLYLVAGDEVIVFNGNGQLLRVNQDGANLQQIPISGGLSVYSASISPDGNHLAVSLNDATLWRIDADGANPLQLAANGGGDNSWSPDGRSVSYIATSYCNEDVWLAGSDGSGAAPFIDASVGGVSGNVTHYADWSGTNIIAFDGFACGRSCNGGLLYTINPDRSSLQQIISGGTYSNWSPDGRRLAYHSCGNIYLANADGSDIIQLTTDGISIYPCWSPDGTKIAFLRNDNIWSMTIDGSNQQQITFGSYPNAQPDWGILGNVPSPPPPPAEPFAEIAVPLTPTYGSAAAWGDYDSDRDLDILYTGNNAQFDPHTPAVNPVSRIYRNDSGSFQDAGVMLSPMWSGEVAWGDYDNDGDLDILMTGVDASNTPRSKIYQNNEGDFQDIGAPLIGVRDGVAAWGDYDNDGDLDILLAGTAFDGNYFRTSRIYQNQGGSFVDIQGTLTGVDLASGAWGDYDNDGDLDILLAGNLGGAQFKTTIYLNDSGTFSDINAGLIGVWGASVAWGDYDNDGDLDILLSGNTQLHYSGALVSRVYRNDNGSFQDISAGLLGLYGGSAAWGDYDNDGDLDILLIGETRDSNSPEPFTKVYRNDNGSFQDISASLVGVAQSTGVWGDCDNDGDLDILIVGENNFTPTVKIYRNETDNANATPAAPAGLFTAVTNDTVYFGWTDSDDAETPQQGLSYNLIVGKTTGGAELVSPMSHLDSGYRRIVQPGNAGQKTVWMLTNVGDGTYSWSVQAIDQAFAGSPFSGPQAFSVCNHPPRADAGQDKEIFIGEIVALGGNPTVIGSASPYTFKWSPAYGLDDPASANPLAAPTATVTYTLEVTDANGCTSTDEVTIVVHSFVLAANDFVLLARNKNSSGDIHSNGGIEFNRGAPGSHTGDLTAVQNISIRDKNTIVGDVTAGGIITIARGGVVNGNSTSQAYVPMVPMPTLAFVAGGANQIVPRNRSVVLSPGSYGRVTVNENGILLLSAGSYFLNALETRGAAVLSIDASAGPVRINVVSKLTFGARTRVEIDGAATDQVIFSTLQNTEVSIARESVVRGALLAPNAPVHLLANCQFTGSICAKKITLETSVIFHPHTTLGETLPMLALSQEMIDKEASVIEELPTEYELSQNYPNPFNPSTTIAYKLPERAKVTLHVFSINGQLVRTLINSEMPPGFHTAIWNGRDEAGNSVATGVYFYLMETSPSRGGATFKQSRQMVFVK